MTESSDIDFSLANIWRAWYVFRSGKKSSQAIVEFEYFLEPNLWKLHQELTNGCYCPGRYIRRIVRESKPRNISIAPIRDRVVHRLIYDYLVSVYDKTFYTHVYSCRPNKGLFKALLQSQQLLSNNQHGWIWRADINKFFDSIDQTVLVEILARKLEGSKLFGLIKQIISSNTPDSGIPIGNLTSQILANIYLNEFDRFVIHTLKPCGYVRYGDDFIIVGAGSRCVRAMRQRSAMFLNASLILRLHKRNDVIVKVRYGISFLGVEVFPRGKRIMFGARRRIYNRLTYYNASSYYGFIFHQESYKNICKFVWELCEKI